VPSTSTSQIYQQRGPDGSIVLTDRPSPTALTQRTWQVEREDPVAARQRARDLRLEAEAVSERVQRRMDAQQRLLEADMERARARDQELRLARLEEERDVGTVILPGYGYPQRNRGGFRRGPGNHNDAHPWGHRPGLPPGRPPRPTGSGSPGSR